MLALCHLAVVAGLVAVTGMVAGLAAMPEGEKMFRLILSVITVVGSWLFLHTVLALHYAHHHYWPWRKPGEPEAHRGGPEFPGSEAPDYANFL